MAMDADTIGRVLSISEEAAGFLGKLVPFPFSLMAGYLVELLDDVQAGVDPVKINAQADLVEAEMARVMVINQKHRDDISQSQASMAARAPRFAELIAEAERELAGGG